MTLLELVFDRFRTIGGPGRLLVATSFAAAFNFCEILLATKNWLDSRTVAGYTITACYFGPPPSFYPRFFIACSLLVATVAIFVRSFPRSLTAVAGVFGALSVYGYWWIASYTTFRNLSAAEIHFIGNPEIRQTAYLYGGTWFDIGIAASVVVCSVLLVDRFSNAGRS